MEIHPITFTMLGWDEKDLAKNEQNAKITEVKALFKYEGIVSGNTELTYVMQYNPDGTGVFDGYEVLKGSFNGVEGQVYIRHEGSFEPKAVYISIKNVPQSGTGGFEKANFSAKTVLAGHGPYNMDLTVD